MFPWSNYQLFSILCRGDCLQTLLFFLILIVRIVMKVTMNKLCWIMFHKIIFSFLSHHQLNKYFSRKCLHHHLTNPPHQCYCILGFQWQVVDDKVFSELKKIFIVSMCLKMRLIFFLIMFPPWLTSVSPSSSTCSVSLLSLVTLWSSLLL